MSDTYIGFRVELASRIIKSDPAKIVERYNAEGSAKMFDLHTSGKITIERTNSMIIARGEKDNRQRQQGGMVNFSVMTPIESKELDRVVQIINVLGNGRLIRERVKTFADGNSMLNKIPELAGIANAFSCVESYIPGFTLGGWYYAPEAKF